MNQINRTLSLFMALLFILAVLPTPALADEPEQRMVDDVAAALTEGCDTTEEKTMEIYRYISRYFKYDYELYHAVLAKKNTNYTPDPERTLNARKGVYYDLAALFAAMFHSQVLQVKLVKGYHNRIYHAWNSVYDAEADRWVQLDVTMDLCRGRHRKTWREIDPAEYKIKTEVLYDG